MTSLTSFSEARREPGYLTIFSGQKKPGKKAKPRSLFGEMPSTKAGGVRGKLTDTIRGAADLAVFRANSQQTQYHRQAVAHLTHAVSEWETYTKASAGRYRPQLFSRTHYMDWEKLLEDVKQEVETVRAEAK